VQLTDSYVLMKNGEAFLLGAQITPLDTVSTHYVTDPTRTRKLLLKKRELARILAAVSQKGQTCVCTQLYWKGHLVKARIALAQGKQAHDKRDTEKDREWNRQKQRIVRDAVKQ
jgi:SsrA-binding protein